VLLIDGSTGVRFSAHPRFAPTFSFHHIGLTGTLIYIKLRRLDFLSYSSSSHTAAALLSSHTAAAPLSRRSRAARGHTAATTPQPHCHHSHRCTTTARATAPLLCSCHRCTTAATALPVATIHSRNIRRSIRRLIPSLNPTCHGSRQEEGQGTRG
jgi:hypothetical protein